MIAELLRYNEAEEITIKELSERLNQSEKEIHTQAEREASKGKLICFTGKGYYLARNKKELKRYLEKSSHEAISILKFRNILSNWSG